MTSLLAVLFFAATGVTLNHPDWLAGESTRDFTLHRGRDAGDRARGDKTAYEAAAEKGARLAGTELSDEERERYGSTIHWALGVGAGALYGVLRDQLPDAGLARGLLFGTAFWLLVDEGA